MIQRLSEFAHGLPARPWLLALLVVVGMGVVGAGGYYSYSAYEFVEHDNDFCLSCHLMEDAFEKFAQSEHRGLGCKACHQPNLIGRSQMALTQIIEQPEELTTHAEVPNERCAACHIEGNPEEWELIVNSAGHRVHLESQDSVLQGLNCVGCHSTSLHEFTSTDQTCGQSGCHEDTEIELGRMGDFTIQCAACHDFSKPVYGDAEPGAPAQALRPDQDTCLSCHQMNVLIDLPPDDPHEGECASCHNPHEQSRPEDAVATCVSSSCHDDVTDLTPLHNGLEPGVVEGCSSCHSAHDFEVEAADCLACHTDVQGGSAVRTASPPEASFSHDDHTADVCSTCHESEEVHAQVTVTSVTDCRSCHHEEPVVTDCAACHTPGDFPTTPFTRSHEMAFDVGDRVVRDLPFDHADHEAADCATCHQEDLTLSAEATSCSSCHEDHHEPERECTTCHVAPPVEAHPAEVHVGCSGSGCHEESPLDLVPRTRPFCLVCHQESTDHKVDSEVGCEGCHTLPQPTAAKGRAR